jgi:VanZ family protein
MLLWLLMAVTCGFAFAPHAPELKIENGDKFQHILAFGSLASCALLAARRRTRAAWLGVLAGMLAFGVFIELVQVFLPTRSADWQDVVADMLGASLGVLVIAAARRLLPEAPRVR